MKSIQIFDSRDEMIRNMVPKNTVGCEVGVYAGEFSQKLLSITNPKELLLIDAWDLGITDIPCADEHGNNFIHMPSKVLCDITVNRFSKNPNVHIVKEWSYNIIPKLPYSHFDWVYLDACHRYQECLNDLYSIEDKMKKDSNSLIMGHDYEFNYEKCKNQYDFGVGRAVDTFCETRGWEMIAKGMDGCVSYCLQRKG